LENSQAARIPLLHSEGFMRRGRVGFHQANVRVDIFHVFEGCIFVSSNREKAGHADALVLRSTTETRWRVVQWTVH